MPNKQDRAVYYEKLGRSEGKFDCLFTDRYSTLEDRAKCAFHSLGLKSYKEDFIKGYINANNKESTP